MSGATDDTSLIDIRNLGVTYSNGARGVRDVSLAVHSGEIVAVLGRNGAGKTTMLRGIGGFLRSEHVSVSGTVLFDGRDIAGMSPARTFKQGIVLVPERDKVFAALTVEDHLRLASPHGKSKPSDPCGFEPLERLRNTTAGLLSGGERQMLALEIAWRSEPRLLLVDEVSLGLAPVVVKDLMQRLRAVAQERGTAIIIVEQDAAAALRVANRVYVIRLGEVAWEGESTETSAQDIAVHYLGTATPS
jgi:ABC-type branched-subunit amino acid transport system ATPase component